MKLVALTPLLLLGVSCKSSSGNMTGTWHSFRQGADTLWHFFPDGKLETIVNYRGTVIQASGTYGLDGNLLMIRNTEATALAPTPDAEQVRAKLLEPGGIQIKFNSPYNISAQFPDSNEPLIWTQVSPKP